MSEEMNKVLCDMKIKIGLVIISVAPTGTHGGFEDSHFANPADFQCGQKTAHTSRSI